MTALAWVAAFWLAVAALLGVLAWGVRSQGAPRTHISDIPEEYWQYLPGAPDHPTMYFTQAQIDAAKAKCAAKVAGTVGQ